MLQHFSFDQQQQNNLSLLAAIIQLLLGKESVLHYKDLTHFKC